MSTRAEARAEMPLTVWESWLTDRLEAWTSLVKKFFPSPPAHSCSTNSKQGLHSVDHRETAHPHISQPVLDTPPAWSSFRKCDSASRSQTLQKHSSKSANVARVGAASCKQFLASTLARGTPYPVNGVSVPRVNWSRTAAALSNNDSTHILTTALKPSKHSMPLPVTTFDQKSEPRAGLFFDPGAAIRTPRFPMLDAEWSIDKSRRTQGAPVVEQATVAEADFGHKPAPAPVLLHLTTTRAHTPRPSPGRNTLAPLLLQRMTAPVIPIETPKRDLAPTPTSRHDRANSAQMHLPQSPGRALQQTNSILCNVEAETPAEHRQISVRPVRTSILRHARSPSHFATATKAIKSILRHARRPSHFATATKAITWHPDVVDGSPAPAKSAKDGSPSLPHKGAAGVRFTV